MLLRAARPMASVYRTPIGPAKAGYWKSWSAGAAEGGCSRAPGGKTRACGRPWAIHWPRYRHMITQNGAVVNGSRGAAPARAGGLRNQRATTSAARVVLPRPILSLASPREVGEECLAPTTGEGRGRATPPACDIAEAISQAGGWGMRRRCAGTGGTRAKMRGRPSLQKRYSRCISCPA